MSRTPRAALDVEHAETQADLDDDDLLDDEWVDDDPDLLEPPTLAWRRRTAIEMVISGLIGIYTSFILSIEAIALAADKDAGLSCDINAVISCSAVGVSWQASLFGFPNAFIGIAAEAVVITIAVAMIGGVIFPRWYMASAQVFYTLGLIFAYWLFYEALTDIKALCPWCLLITVTTTLLWAGLTRINIRDGVFSLPGRAGPWGRRFVASGYDWFVTAAAVIGIAVVILAIYGVAVFA